MLTELEHENRLEEMKKIEQEKRTDKLGEDLQRRKEILHLMYVPMTGLGLHDGYRGDDWFKYRIELFKNYTLKSLLNQTNKNFVIWMSFRPEEEDNPITKRFADFMAKMDLACVFTFGGLCFWDDKYPDSIAGKRLKDNLEISMKELREKLGGIMLGKKFVYETIQPSDDLYHKDAVEEIKKKEIIFDKQAMIFKNGYMHNTENRRVAEYNPTTNPPFYTLIYPVNTFFNPEKHIEYMRGFKSHEDILKLFDCIQLPDNKYCVVVHKKNISTNWQHPFRGKIYSIEEGAIIMRRFGLEIGEMTTIKAKALDIKILTKRLIKRYLLRVLIKLRLYNYAKRAKRYITRKK